MKKGLGRGLDALLAQNAVPEAEQSGPIRIVPLATVEPNRNQPRKYFDQAALHELADSIHKNGLLQPLVVRPLENDRYQIISGERRWRACRLAEVKEIPVVVREEDDRAALELGLIENLQREDLNVVEEAQGYRVLMDEYQMTQENVAERVGKSRPVVANALRILQLPPDVLNLVAEGKLSSGHGRALLPLCNTRSPEELLHLAQEAIDKGWTVRQLEQMGKQLPKKPLRKVTRPDPYLTDAESLLTQTFGRKVQIVPAVGKHKGSITLEYYNNEDLNLLLSQLMKENEDA